MTEVASETPSEKEPEFKSSRGSKGFWRKNKDQLLVILVTAVILFIPDVFKNVLATTITDLFKPGDRTVVESSITTVTSMPPQTSTSTPDTSVPATTRPSTPTTKPSGVTTLLAGSFSNGTLSAAESSGQPTWSTVAMTREMLVESTQHDNAKNLEITTALTPDNCKWESGTLYFMSAGTCQVKISVAQATRSARYKALVKRYKILVTSPVLDSPAVYSPHTRVRTAVNDRSNFLTDGAEIPTEFTYGDLLGYWRMRLRVSMKQPDQSLGTVRCFRIYARYQYSTSQSSNDFTEDNLSCSDLSGTTVAKEYCVNFQPSWVSRQGTTNGVRMEFVSSTDPPFADKFTRVKFKRVGWAVEWGWQTYNQSFSPKQTLTTQQISLVESETHRPAVDVLEIAAGKCP